MNEHESSSPESPAKEQPGEVAAMVKRLREPWLSTIPLDALCRDAAALIEKLGQRVNQLERVLELYCPNHPLLSASDLDIVPPPPERP